MKKCLYWFPAVCWMILIFSLSSQPYSKQDIRPFLKENIPQSFVKERMGDLKVQYSGKEISIETKGVSGFLEFFIRKGAHIFVFMVLTIAIQWAVQKTWNWGIGTYVFSFLLTSLFAASDELHQYFTPNRTAKVEDIAIDMAGILIGLLIMFVINQLRRPIKSNERQKLV